MTFNFECVACRYSVAYSPFAHAGLRDVRMIKGQKYRPSGWHRVF